VSRLFVTVNVLHVLQWVTVSVSFSASVSLSGSAHFELQGLCLVLTENGFITLVVASVCMLS